MTFQPMLSQAMWDYNVKQINATTRSMLDYAEIEGVSVVNTENETVSYGLINGVPASQINNQTHIKNSLTNNQNLIIPYQYDITYWENAKEKHIVGHATIYSSYEVLITRTQYTLLLILASAITKTLFLCFIFHFVVSRLVAKPLQNLMGRISNFDPGSGYRQNQGNISNNDEISALEETFKRMSDNVNTQNATFYKWVTMCHIMAAR